MVLRETQGIANRRLLITSRPSAPETFSIGLSSALKFSPWLLRSFYVSSLENHLLWLKSGCQRFDSIPAARIQFSHGP